MAEDFQANKPIYLQIMDKICRQIIRKELKPGEKLPSVREMAIQSGVNPNTIQRTYSELERISVVKTKRGQGTFVTEKMNELTEMKMRIQKDVIDEFVANMKELGFTKEEMVTGLKEYLSKGERE